MRGWLSTLAGRIGARLMTFSFVIRAPLHGMDPKAVHMIAMREENAIWDTIRGQLLWHKTEAEVVSARLARRYDLGMALNESASRAIEAKKAAGDPEPDPTGGLTDRQLTAPAFQKQYLQRVVDRS